MLLLLFNLRRLHSQRKSPMRLRTTRPLSTPPATFAASLLLVVGTELIVGIILGVSVDCTALLAEDGWRLATVLAKGVATATSGNISDAVTLTMLAPNEVSISWPVEVSSAPGDDVKNKGEEVLVIVMMDVAAGMLVVLVELGNRLSSSGGRGLVLVLIGTGFSSLVVASIVVVAAVVVVAGNRGLRSVVVRTLLDWTTLSIAVHRLPPVVVKINDLAAEGLLGDDMLEIDLCTSLSGESSRKQ